MVSAMRNFTAPDSMPVIEPGTARAPLTRNPAGSSTGSLATPSSAMHLRGASFARPPLHAPIFSVNKL